MDFKIYNIDNSATGCWYVIHLLAASGEFDALKSVLKTFERRFVCPKCRSHINLYLKQNELKKEIDPWFLFKWTTSFHNAVNIRLKKPIFSEIGELELFRQLTAIADEDGERYEKRKSNKKNKGFGEEEDDDDDDNENNDIEEDSCEGCTSKGKQFVSSEILKKNNEEDEPEKKSSSSKSEENDKLLEKLSSHQWPIFNVQFI